MRLKIPIFVEIDARLSPKELAVLKNRLAGLFTSAIEISFKIPEGDLEELRQKAERRALRLSKLDLLRSFEVEGLEVLTESEFLNRIR